LSKDVALLFFSPSPSDIGITITGYSKAADATYFYIPEWKTMLDVGGSNKSFTGARNFFLTHSHLDHAMFFKHPFHSF